MEKRTIDRNPLDGSQCVHCGSCTKNCPFLSKYNIDIGDTGRLKELAYHCFLCGKCSEVCPLGIDGKGIILAMREEQVKEAGKIPEKGYGMLLLEKKNYLFRNYRHINVPNRKEEADVPIEEASLERKSVFFPGCNFPSFYPETTKKLIKVLEAHGIGVVFDCCGKPVAELGLARQKESIVGEVEKRLKKAGVEELIMACPNCCYFLGPKLKGISVISIYEKLSELGLGKKIEGDIAVFLPCPDRREKKLLRQIEEFVSGQVDIITEASCCGLGGCGSVKEPELSKGMAEALKEAGYGEIHTYCGSCAGNLARDFASGIDCSGCTEVTHLLAKIMETGEKPDIEASFLNRAKTKFY